MANLRSLKRRMDRLKNHLPRKVNDVAKAVGIAVLQGAVKATPVDTSQAVSNWQLGFDEPNFNNLPPHVPGKAGSTRGPSSAETMAVGRIVVRGKLPGQALHISNGLDYIDDINQVYGFEQAAIDAGLAKLAKTQLRLK